MAFSSKINVHRAQVKAVKVANGESSANFPSNFPHVINNETLKSINAAGSGNVDLISAGLDDRVLIGGITGFQPTYQTITLPVILNGDMVDQALLIAPYAFSVKGVMEIHAVAGDDAGTVTVNLTKDTSGVAPGAGTTIMSGTFNAKGTANTVQSATLSSTSGVLDFALGDRIGVNFVGTIATLAGLVITLKISTYGKGDFAVLRQVANGDVADRCFYVANRPQKVAGVFYAHATKGTHASAVNLQITKDTSTNAPGAGSDLLTNNTSAGFDCKGTINVVQTGTLTATTANLWLAPGDRLSGDYSGTLTALAGVIAVVLFEPLYFDGSRDITFTAGPNANIIDHSAFIADRSYEVLDVRQVHSTAGNDGGSVNAQLTIDKQTEAPGGGVNLLTDNTAAGFDLKGTANTVQAGTLAALGNRYMTEGNRLSVDIAGTTTTLAGFVCTATIVPR
jgi:hypothetical protein